MRRDDRSLRVLPPILRDNHHSTPSVSTPERAPVQTPILSAMCNDIGQRIQRVTNLQIRIEAQFAPEPNLPPALPATSAQHGAGGSTRAWWATAVGAYILLCLPLLLVDVPPLTDYPNHMARMDILAQLGREPFLTQVYQARWEVIPDLAIDAFMPWLVTVLPVDVAGRLLLAAILLLDLAGVTACAAALHGRRTWWSLGAALAAYNMAFLMGFLSFNLTLATAMVAAAAWMRLRGSTSAIATPTFGAGAASVLFIGHLLGLLFFALLIGSFEAPLARMRLRNAAPDLASRARAFLASWPLAVSAAPPALLYAISGVSAARNRPRWPIWSDLPIEAMAAFLNYNWPVDVVTACLVVAFLAGCTMWSRLRVAPGAAVAVVAVCVLIPLLPHDFKGGSYFAMRPRCHAGISCLSVLSPCPGRALRAYYCSGVCAALCDAYGDSQHRVVGLPDRHLQHAHPSPECEPRRAIGGTKFRTGGRARLF